MPLYEYQCEACEKVFERIQKFSDPPIDVCPNCGKGPVKKLPSSPAIQFKGSGFYITDYPKKSSPDSGGKSGGSSSSDSSASNTSGSSSSSSSSSTSSSSTSDTKPSGSTSTDKKS
jgi:putative FmdB family regulatory protein